jgi:hypothetical protein
MTDSTFGVFIPGRGTAEKVFGTEEQAAKQAAVWDEKFSSDFEVIETNPKNPEVRPIDPIMFNNSRDELRDEQNSAEDNDDNETTMSYNFIATDDEEAEEQTADDSWSWDFGDHSTASTEERSALSQAIGDAMDGIDEEIDGDMMDVLEDAAGLVSDTRINQFECSHEDCGLGHSHPDWKHDIRASTNAAEIRSMIPGFNITDSFAEEMEFVPFCHCGANEAAMLVQFFPYISEPMFRDQESFDSIEEIDADVLMNVIRSVVSGTGTPKEIASNMASRDTAMFADLQTFLNRVQQMQNQADKAPIGEETRNLIEENREDLEEVCEV